MSIWTEAGIAEPELDSDGAPEAKAALEWLLERQMEQGPSYAIKSPAGDGSTDDVGKAYDLLDYAKARNASRIVIPPPPDGGPAYNWSEGINWNDYGGMSVLGLGQIPSAAVQFEKPPMSTIKCEGGPAFYGSGFAPNNSVFEGLRIIESDCGFKFTGSAVIEINKCAVSVNANSGADTAPIILESCFEVDADRCALEVPDISTTTTATWVAGTDTTITVASTASFPTAGEAAMPANHIDVGGVNKIVRWTGKTSTTLTGVTVLAGTTGSVPSGTRLVHHQPALWIRGVSGTTVSISYLISLTRSSLNRGRILYNQVNDAAGPVPGQFEFKRILWENGYGPPVDLQNSFGGTALEYNSMEIAAISQSDPLNTGFVYNPTVRLGNNVILRGYDCRAVDADRTTELPFFDLETGSELRGGVLKGMHNNAGAIHSGAGTLTACTVVTSTGLRVYGTISDL